jgi:hypothetical protein
VWLTSPRTVSDAARYFCRYVAGIVDDVDVVTEAAVHGVGGAYAAVERVVAGGDLPVGGLGAGNASGRRGLPLAPCCRLEPPRQGR